MTVSLRRWIRSRTSRSWTISTKAVIRLGRFGRIRTAGLRKRCPCRTIYSITKSDNCRSAIAVLKCGLRDAKTICDRTATFSSSIGRWRFRDGACIMNPGDLGDHSLTTDGSSILSAQLPFPARMAGHRVGETGPRIALLTPYAGPNLGDASIQDAMVANIRLRLLDARFSGVTLNCDNFLDRHGAGAFPLTGASVRFYGMSRGRLARRPNERENLVAPSKNSRGIWASAIKSTAKRLPFVPILWQCLRVSLRIPREIRHCVKGFVFLRTQDLLVVSGGGQLNEEYGGAWAHPFTLFKWAVLARMARVPYVVASVGAGKVTSRTSRMFVSAALRAACYRSYRDKHSREIAAGLLGRRAVDVVVPDLAFSLPPTELPKPAAIPSDLTTKNCHSDQPYRICQIR